MAKAPALADTSLFVGLETARIDRDAFTQFDWFTSAITLGELRLGVLHAKGVLEHDKRLSTLEFVKRLEPLAIDEHVADAWGLLVAQLKAAGRKAPINDSWIAATAIAHGMPLGTQDRNFTNMPGLDVILL